jgi:hypothetical protein
MPRHLIDTRCQGGVNVRRLAESGYRRKVTMMSDAKDTQQHDPEGEEKPGGLGQDGTIPDDPDGVAAGHTGEPSTFEPEEDEQA